MNEEKNIETCLAESILAEVASVPQDPQFRSLVNESLDPSRLQAAAQTGWDAYEKVVWTHKPYTFTSSVRQMKSNLILLLRRLWRFPFGRGTIRSFADMWQHYITRLSGNPEYGIPSRLDQLTDLPSAPALLADRKIVSIGVPDGLGIMQLMTSKPSAITAIGDDMVYESCYCDQLYALISALPNLNEMNIHCKRLRGYYYSYNVWFPNTITKVNGSTEVFELPDLERFDGDAYIGFPTEAKNFKKWSFPKLKYSRMSFSHSYNSLDSYVNDWVEEIYMPESETFGEYASNICLCNFTALKTLIMGKPYTYNQSMWLIGDNRLGHLEFRKEVAASLNLSNWNPDSDVIADQQFLSNFKTYIAERLTDQGSGKTLTLSQAVRNAIHAAESTYGIENIIITQKGWTISPAPN